MRRLELFYPIRPHKVNQVWGIYNPFYEQFGFSRHNGIDINLLSNGQPINAPFDCRVIDVGEQTGGGIYVSVLSQDIYSFDDGGVGYVLLDFLHCEKISVVEAQEVVVGQQLAIGDNTGESTGPHTHIQARRVDKDLTVLDTNDANDSFDPEPYFNGVYADTWILLREIQRSLKKLLKLINGSKK